MNKIGNCRIAILIKEGVNVEIVEKLMNEDIASIWLKISTKGKKTVMLGAIYREHCFIRQPEPNNSGQINQQNQRWKMFIDQWVAASTKGDTIVIGDTNLDTNKWASPDSDHIIMTDLVKNWY